MKHSAIYDVLFVLIAVVFIVSLWNILDMEPIQWLWIAGLYVTGNILIPIYKEILKGE